MVLALPSSQAIHVRLPSTTVQFVGIIEALKRAVTIVNPLQSPCKVHCRVTVVTDLKYLYEIPPFFLSRFSCSRLVAMILALPSSQAIHVRLPYDGPVCRETRGVEASVAMEPAELNWRHSIS